MTTKICCMCNLEKPLFDFPEVKKDSTNYRKMGTNYGTHEARCRPCKAAYAREWRKKNTNYKGTGKLNSIPQEDRLLVSAISDRLMQAKARVKKFGGVDPDVDRDYLYQLFKEQHGLCALSGVTLRIEKGAIACLSLDQIKPGIGYVKGNVQWVAWAVNRAKGDMDSDVFLDMCRQIMEYRKVQRLSPSGSTPKRVEAQNPSLMLGEDIV